MGFWDKLGAGIMRFWEMVLDKLRLNVVIIGVLVFFLIKDFGDKIIDRLPGEISTEVLIALMSVGITGLINAMMRMFESPSVPADVHERLMKDRNS